MSDCISDDSTTESSSNKKAASASIARKKNSASSKEGSSFNIPATVTQTQELQESSSDEDKSLQDSEYIWAIKKREIDKEKEQQNKKQSSKTSKTPKCLKQGIWYSKTIPERVQIKRKENNKKKARRLTAETIQKLKKGTLVKKDLIVLIGTKTQTATVFGTIVEKGKGGRWLVHFENDCCFKLKPSKFTFVSNNKKQQVLASNEKNEIELKDPKQDHMDTISSDKRNDEFVDVYCTGTE